MTLKKKIAKELEKAGIDPTDEAIRDHLADLYHEQRMSSRDIGVRYSVGPATVRALLRQMKVPRKSPGGGKFFDVQMKKRGYIDINDFFGRNATKTKADMARELGVSYSSLCTHYEKWEEQFI